MVASLPFRVFCRLFYAGAEHHQMPEILSMIQISHLTPVPSVIAMCLLSLVYLTSQDIYALINYVGFATWLAIGLAVACLPYLRWKQPDLPRPIKVHLFWPIIYILATVFITIVPMIADPYGTGLGCLIIASGVPVYLIFIAWKNKPKPIASFFGTFFFIKILKINASGLTIDSLSLNFYAKYCYWLGVLPLSCQLLIINTSPTDALTRLLQKVMVVVPSEKQESIWAVLFDKKRKKIHSSIINASTVNIDVVIVLEINVFNFSIRSTQQNKGGKQT